MNIVKSLSNVLSHVLNVLLICVSIYVIWEEYATVGYFRLVSINEIGREDELGLVNFVFVNFAYCFTILGLLFLLRSLLIYYYDKKVRSTAPTAVVHSLFNILMYIYGYME